MIFKYKLSKIHLNTIVEKLKSYFVVDHICEEVTFVGVRKQYPRFTFGVYFEVSW